MLKIAVNFRAQEVSLVARYLALGLLWRCIIESESIRIREKIN